MKQKQNRTQKRKQTIANSENSTLITGGKFNYPIFQLAYNNNLIACEICATDKFHKIDVSVERSKTATVATNILFGNDITDIVSHPLTLYKCITCQNCKFFYTPTAWNKLTTPILVKQIMSDNV